MAMPLSVLIACLVFAWFGLSINTMTLGGLAVAIGELVDDAIVDVENIFRRLRENFRLPEAEQKSAIRVVYDASAEIRNSIVYGTMIVVMVFFPIFFLPGMEGRLFSPLGMAYVVSILSSLAVSLTLTPVLAFFLLPSSARKSSEKEGLILRLAQFFAGGAIRVSLAFPKLILTLAFASVLFFGWVFLQMERDFVPPFNEGAPQVNVTLAPGKSLETSEAYGDAIAARLFQIEGVLSVVRKTGRAELDEHAVPVNQSEMLCTLDLNSDRGIDEIFNDIDRILTQADTPGAVSFYDQPLQHAISHLRTGSSSTIAVKIRGSEMQTLRQRANRIQSLISGIPGIGSVRIDPVQIDIPQLQITLDRDALAVYGLTPDAVNRTVEIAMQGAEASQILDGEKKFDILLRHCRRNSLGKTARAGEDPSVIGSVVKQILGKYRYIHVTTVKQSLKLLEGHYRVHIFTYTFKLCLTLLGGTGTDEHYLCGGVGGLDELGKLCHRGEVMGNVLFHLGICAVYVLHECGTAGACQKSFFHKLAGFLESDHVCTQRRLYHGMEAQIFKTGYYLTQLCICKLAGDRGGNDGVNAVFLALQQIYNACDVGFVGDSAEGTLIYAGTACGALVVVDLCASVLVYGDRLYLAGVLAGTGTVYDSRKGTNLCAGTAFNAL